MATKLCPTCNEEKDLDSFIKPSLYRCRECANRYASKRRQQKREAEKDANPQPIRISKPCTICGVDKPFAEFNFANRQRGILSSYCKPCQHKVSNAHRATSGRIREKCAKLKTTVAWYYQQLELQNNVCAICKQPETHPCQKNGPARALAIDHGHLTGRLRGLLCFRCNTSIHLIDKFGPSWAVSALEYLKQ